jgi:hypothetical protein
MGLIEIFLGSLNFFFWLGKTRFKTNGVYIKVTAPRKQQTNVS